MLQPSSRSSSVAGAWFAGFAVLAFFASAARADDAASVDTAQVAIPAAQHGAALADWEADEDQGLWVEDAHARWYYANFTATCPALRLATSLSFDTGASDTFGPLSSIQLPNGARCIVSSLKPSTGPDSAADSSKPVSTDPKLSRQ